MGGAALATLLLVPVLYYNTPGGVTRDASLFRTRIAAIEGGAFGSLSGQANVPTGLGAASSEMARTQQGGGGSAGMMADKMIAPVMTQYNYVYTGDEFAIPSETMAVYRRVKGSESARELGAYLSRFNTGLMNLGALGGAEVRNFELGTSGKDGYSLRVDVDNGNISLNRNMSGWQAPAGCVGEACNPRPLSVSDVPSDDEVIRLANAFLSAYGVETSGFGEPRVDNNWRVYYNQAADKSMAWVPDILTVTYPKMIDGQVTYDFGGNSYGLQVSVDIRNRQAVGFWNLTSSQFEKSAYQVEQNKDRIMDFVKRGGVFSYNYWYNNGETKIVDVSVGTPTIGLVQQTQWDEFGGKELYVPAYIFPVVNPPAEYFGNRYIVIPLPKDILDSYNVQPVDGPIRIMNGAAEATTLPAEKSAQ